MEPTTSRRIQLSMSLPRQFAAMCALARGGSSCSRLMDFARTKLLVILAAGHLISSSVLKAQACYDYAGTYAKDAKGERHSYKDYPRHRPPWLDDQIKTFAPIYSYSD